MAMCFTGKERDKDLPPSTANGRHGALGQSLGVKWADAAENPTCARNFLSFLTPLK
jgi:hypothetical protein